MESCQNATPDVPYSCLTARRVSGGVGAAPARPLQLAGYAARSAQSQRTRRAVLAGAERPLELLIIRISRISGPGWSICRERFGIYLRKLPHSTSRSRHARSKSARCRNGGAALSSRLIASLVRSCSLVVRGDSSKALARGWFANCCACSIVPPF